MSIDDGWGDATVHRMPAGPPGRGWTAAGSGRGREPGQGAQDRGHAVYGWGVGGDEGRSTGSGCDDCVAMMMGVYSMCGAWGEGGGWDAWGHGVSCVWAPAGAGGGVLVV